MVKLNRYKQMLKGKIRVILIKFTDKGDWVENVYDGNSHIFRVKPELGLIRTHGYCYARDLAAISRRNRKRFSDKNWKLMNEYAMYLTKHFVLDEEVDWLLLNRSRDAQIVLTVEKYDPMQAHIQKILNRSNEMN